MIPIDQCHEKILLGVTRYGGHITYLEGGYYLPTQQWWTKPTMEFLGHFIQKATEEQQSPVKLERQ